MFLTQVRPWYSVLYLAVYWKSFRISTLRTASSFLMAMEYSSECVYHIYYWYIFSFQVFLLQSTIRLPLNMYSFPCLWIYLQDKFLEVELLSQKICIVLTPITKMSSKEVESIYTLYNISLVSSVAQSCPTLCDPMNCSTPGLSVYHQRPEFTQTHVHRVSDAIQPSHPLSSPAPPPTNPSQHQSLFQWVNSSHEVAKVLELQL